MTNNDENSLLTGKSVSRQKIQYIAMSIFSLYFCYGMTFAWFIKLLDITLIVGFKMRLRFIYSILYIEYKLSS